MSWLEKFSWNPLTPASVPTGARISAGKSGRVLTSLPNAADTSVSNPPTSCIPSPLSPQKRITTPSSCSSFLAGWESRTSVEDILESTPSSHGGPCDCRLATTAGRPIIGAGRFEDGGAGVGHDTLCPFACSRIQEGTGGLVVYSFGKMLNEKMHDRFHVHDPDRRAGRIHNRQSAIAPFIHQLDDGHQDVVKFDSARVRRHD